MNRQVIYSRENIEAVLSLDNKFCKSKIKEAIFSIQQRLTIKNGFNNDGKKVFKRYVYKEVEPLNIEAGSEERVLKKVYLELNNSKYPFSKKKINKAGNKVLRPEQESVLLSCLAPTTESKHIKNEYKLSVIIKIDGATTAQYPRYSLPITILPLPNCPPKLNMKDDAICLDDDFQCIVKLKKEFKSKWL